MKNLKVLLFRYFCYRFLSGKIQNSLVRRFILILLKLQPRELLKRISFKAQALLQVYFDAHKVIPEKTFSGK